MLGSSPQTVEVNQAFTESSEINPFDRNVNKIYGLAVSASIQLNGEDSKVEFVLLDENFNEYLIYESYGRITKDLQEEVEAVSEETCILDGVKIKSIKVIVSNATVQVKSFQYSDRSEFAQNVNELRKEQVKEQHKEKVARINSYLKEKGEKWVAGITTVSELSYAERKSLYGQSSFPSGFEFYAGGVISTESTTTTELKSAATASPYVEEWDWRNRHGRNWISPVTNQGACGSCWAFASTGAVEAMVNVYFNQQINPDLSEQDVLSCSGAGTCSGGYPSKALDYIRNTGVVDENTFPYQQADLDCASKGTNPSQQFKIQGRIDFGSTLYPRTDDDLKRMLIEKGPISGGLYDWSHAMVLVGYKVVEEGDRFYYRDLNLKRYWVDIQAGDPLIGKTVWIFKNSWGIYHGDQGYVYVETPISNIGWTHAIQTPITSLVNDYKVVCEDRDGDGYYWWGIGAKPEGLNIPDQADGNDSDPNLGPLNEYGYCIPLNAAPVADFSSNSTGINIGESVTFTDRSANVPSTWNWTFEGGNPANSNAKNPVVSYAVSGSYNVSLTVSNANGSDTKTITDYITVTKPVILPVADFSVNTTSVIAGGSITFQDQSSNNPISWVWEFAGGSPATSTDQNPIVTYNIAGTYQVKLTVTNADGSDTKIADNLIEVTTVPVIKTPPVADFSASQTTINSGETVNFSDLSTNAPTSRSWTFAGGTPSSSTLQNPSITYANAGNYSVSLTVTNADGTDTKTLESYILVKDPVLEPIADFASNKNKVMEGEQVNFSDQSQNNPVSWNWVFEGGTPSSSTERNPVVTYKNASSYKVSLTVKNDGGTNTKIIDNYILVEKPQPEYCIPSPIASSEWISKVQIGGNYHSSSSEGYADFTAATFKFEAGSSYSVQLSPGFDPRSKFEYWAIWIDYNQDYTFTDDEKVYSSSKSKTMVSGQIYIPASMELTTRMRVAMGGVDPTACNFNELGEVEDYTIVISQPVPQPPVADFAANIYTVTEGESVQFSDLSANDPTSWSWTFPGAATTSSPLQNPIITYNTAGVYNVSLTVGNALGTSSLTKTSFINVVAKGEATYCTPVNINSSSCFINEIAVSNYTAQSGADKYSFSRDIINLNPGGTYNVELYPSDYSVRNFWRIWVDLNGDGDFDDSDETLLTVNNHKGSVISSIAIPSYANGTARLRISMKSGKAPASCDDNFDGEVEDYEVSFGSLPGQGMASSDNSMDVINENFISVYPNPTEDNVNLRLTEVSENDSYAVYNSLGAKIMENQISSVFNVINLGNQPSGMYIITVRAKDHIYTSKIIRK
ncbi:PKD domain-containing protein [Maribellus sp. CM-23]|uniref:PKD domain-containing protein n=1 Tax=Maribellus sp. CM-23 TaxID=2781026 RepID=UPI001F19A9D9|nr:PKD domain-containing protein [Maribellus sp. CM-23]MCE4566931.1 PKD domain-containing protein [Maribellus sp. CM-23]